MIREAQPPKSSLSQIQREIRQEQNSDSTLNQDLVTPAPYHIPIEAVSVIVRESTRMKSENALCSCVLGSSRHSEAE